MLNTLMDGFMLHIISNNLKLKILNLGLKIINEIKWNQEDQSMLMSLRKKDLKVLVN